MLTTLARSVALAAVLSALGCGGTDVKMECESNDDCFAGYACDLASTLQCLRACETSNDCVGSEECDVPGGETTGVCRLPLGD